MTDFASGLPIVHKVVACLIRHTGPQPELLVFDHYDRRFDAGTQLPKGGQEPGEDPVDGALRELLEETGVTGARVLQPLPTVDEVMDAGSGQERVRFHTTLLAPGGVLADRWIHSVTGGGDDAGMQFACWWLPLYPDQVDVVVPSQRNVVREVLAALPAVRMTLSAIG